MSCSWDHIRSQVRQFRTNLQNAYPTQVLTILKDFTIHNKILYLLSNNQDPSEWSPTRHMQLYQVQLEQLDQLQNEITPTLTDREYLEAISTIPILKRNLTFTEYNVLVEKESDHSFVHRQLPLPGVSTFHIRGNIILLNFQNDIYVGEIGKIPNLLPYKTPLLPRSGSPVSPQINPLDDSLCKQTTYTATTDHRTDPKLGGYNNDLIAFIRNRDIWVTGFEGLDTQLTFCSRNEEDETLKCGTAEYMMQEEFHRFTGYHWCPTSNGQTERILYLETSEKEVEQVVISKSNHGTATDSIRYPRAGQPNAKSTLKIVEFDFAKSNIVHKQLWNRQDIKFQFPWMEYIVRFGWIPNGKSIWAQVLSRDQKKSALILLYPSQFHQTMHDTMEPIQVLWEETSHYWINITDTFYFMKHADHVKCIWSSESVNGYRHLFLIEQTMYHKQVTQLTSGDWCCVDRPLFVDEARSLIYFSAKLDTPVETHFYVVSYSKKDQPRLLTQLGFSHTVTMDSPDYFVDCFSSLHDSQVNVVRKVNHHSEYQTQQALLMSVAIQREPDETPPSPPPSTNSVHSNEENFFFSSKYGDSVEPNGEIFNFTTSDGANLCGCLYKPRHYEPGKMYPTLLHIYGGPKTQLVVNEFKFPRLVRYLMSAYFGFAVVIIDSRGSSDRGLRFEAHVKHRLGTVELKDQLEGLQFLHDTKFGAICRSNDGLCRPVIDMERLAITGWSYGGYLSLMALGQYPDVFKIAIAGAPVTQWELYDAAYTERYMGLPSENEAAYRASNVLTYVDRFPSSENRLLIAHGLIDENVHFRNTELLVSQLVKHRKPHYLQVYPSEKHGLRHASVNEHFETLMFYWLVNYL